MARARNIKPAFFKNEILGQADPHLSLLFVSLWTLADREGRLEDRPLRIKAETFPYREVPDFNGYLTQLEQHGFIDRYQVGDFAIIQIVNFRKHQAPHNTEKASELPERPVDIPITVKQPLKAEKVTQAKRPDSLISDSLIPDSLNLIPESKHPSDASSPPAEKPPKADHIPYQKIINLYHETLPTLPKVEILTTKRKGQIAARWKNGLQDLPTWKEYFEHVSESGFLMGKKDPSNGHKRFIADLEWLTNETNFAKVAEGKYHGV